METKYYAAIGCSSGDDDLVVWGVGDTAELALATAKARGFRKGFTRITDFPSELVAVEISADQFLQIEDGELVCSNLGIEAPE